MKPEFLFVLFFPLFVAAQTESKEGFTKENFAEESLRIENRTKQFVTNPGIRQIEIIDLRQDSTSSGYSYGGISYNYFFSRLEPITTRSLLQYLTGSQNGLLHQDSGYTVYCFLKRLRLSDELSEEPDEEKKLQQEGAVSGITCDADFFIADQAYYYPLLHVDTLIAGKKSIGKNAGNYTEELLNLLVTKLNKPEISTILSRARKISPSDVQNYYKNLVTFSILKEQPVKGIYRSYKNFITNKPDTTAFTVENGRKGDFLYTLKPDGTPVLETTIWGYCDGKDMYVYSANNFFKLIRTADTYSIWGAKDFTRVRNIRPNFDTRSLIVGMESNYSKTGTTAKYYLKKRPLQLDLLNGEFY